MNIDNSEWALSQDVKDEQPTIEVPVLDLTVLGYYADGKPRYHFHTSFPGDVSLTKPHHPGKPAKAYKDAAAIVKDYQQNMWPGGMGSVYGVALVDGQCVGVYQTYYSNS